MIIRRLIVVLILLLLLPINLIAHELSTTFVSAELTDGGNVSGELKLDVLDLKDVLTLDMNANGELTWGELQMSKALIQNYVSNGLYFSLGGEQCRLDLNTQLKLQELTGVTYLVMPFSSSCFGNGDLSFNYSMLFDAATNHKAIFSVLVKSQQHVFIVDEQSGNDTIVIGSAQNSAWATFTAFIYQGVVHILIGIDHILFLLTLLLTLCFYRHLGEWKNIESKKVVVKKTLLIITSFTIAHSITLSGTALGLIPSMASWIEVVIAASILFNVINNIFPMIRNLGLITFIFGLIHGMGFAGALAEFGFTKEHQVLSVLGFNLGVELGQLGLLLVFLPILFLLRKSNIYRRYGMQAISILIGAIAVYWILERW